MPYIPLQVPTQVAMPGKPVLDREQRPNVDFSKVIQGMGALGEANKHDTVNAAPFIAAAGAGGLAIGEALIKTGGARAQRATRDRRPQDAGSLH